MREKDERMRNNVVEYERKAMLFEQSLGYSCVHAGKPCVRCFFFWKKREDGKPFCWQQGPSTAPMEDLPKGIRAKVQELRHGFSTRWAQATKWECFPSLSYILKLLAMWM